MNAAVASKKQEDMTAKVQCIKNETHLSIFISDLILEHILKDTLHSA